MWFIRQLKREWFFESMKLSLFIWILPSSGWSSLNHSTKGTGLPLPLSQNKEIVEPSFIGPKVAPVLSVFFVSSSMTRTNAGCTETETKGRGWIETRSITRLWSGFDSFYYYCFYSADTVAYGAALIFSPFVCPSVLSMRIEGIRCSLRIVGGLITNDGRRDAPERFEYYYEPQKSLISSSVYLNKWITG